MTTSRSKILKELILNLDAFFDTEYNKRTGTEYIMRSSYGKYTVYRWDFVNGIRTSSTLAKGLSKEEATGMMKLLKEPK
jgi:hypothetical protein